MESELSNSLFHILLYFNYPYFQIIIIYPKSANCQFPYTYIYIAMLYNNNNNNNCLKSNIQCIEIRVQWTVHLGSSHMHVHAVTRVHAVTPKLVICVMYLTSI